MNAIGKPINRVDGHDKVIGKARYAAEFGPADLLYGAVLSSAIAKGRITRIDTAQALALPGVRLVLTHENRPETARFSFQYMDQDAPVGKPFRPLRDARIRYSGQPIALVVADSFEVARYATTLIAVTYAEDDFSTNFQAAQRNARKPKWGFSPTGFLRPPDEVKKGDVEKTLTEAPLQLSATYSHGVQHHNPMELFASTVVYEAGGKLTIYDKTQGAPNSQLYVAQVFGMPFKDVRVISPFVGGAFGSGLRPQYQLFLAVMAARELQQSVRVVLTRPQMFTFGHRPATLQHLTIGAETDGSLLAFAHDVINETSTFEEYYEPVARWANTLYAVPAVRQTQQVVPLDMFTPMDMRAPGGVTGVHAIECMMDELAYQTQTDPLTLRLRNYADKDFATDKPFSSKELRACYQQGADAFGWEKRPMKPQSMKKGDVQVGWGMATGIWEAQQMPARAEAALTVDGKLRVSSATADIGTGTYTVMTQIAADALGVSAEDVAFSLGDSDMPVAPIEGGSFTVSTVGSAVKAACEKLVKKLFSIARKLPDSPLRKAKRADLEIKNGRIILKKDTSVGVSFAQLLSAYGGKAIRVVSTSVPNMLEQRRYALYAHSAVFAEVEVDELLGSIRVTRLVSAIAGGRIINPKTARSQILGGMVWGISMALQEETVLDHTYGRFVNANLADYHIPVQADIHQLEVLFVDETDAVVNPLGAKGLGEIGMVGVSAAIANAVFHATGRRIRQLPITLDKLL